jgi:hypothetical protein
MSADKFLEAVAAFDKEILVACPEIAQILQDARQGLIRQEEAVRRVWTLGSTNDDLRSRVERALLTAFEVEAQSTDLAHFPERETALSRWGFTEEDLVFQPFEDRPGYKMLHPLFMGMIVELLQFDGDVPELRTGPLPEGGHAAVPVHTTARDPVVIGAMLKRASQDITDHLRRAQAAHDESVAKMLEAVGGPTPDHGLVRQEFARGVGVEGYEPGRPVALRDVAPPTGAELAAMTFDERQGLAHMTLTSTQGRRSSAPVIADMVLSSLHEAGYTGTQIDDRRGTRSLVTAEWTVSIDGGRTERNPNFNFIVVAARSLATKLGRGLADRASKLTPMALRVSPINTVADRVVGWRAELLE